MRILGRLRAVAGTATRLRIRRQVGILRAAAEDCRKTQRETLHRLLALNHDSRFAIQHGLTKSLAVDEFRSRIAVTDYDFYRPQIDQLRNGDHRALLGSANPLMMFSLSSGTTQESKYIPITSQFLKDYRRGWQIWGIRTLDDYPAVNALNILQLTSDHDRFRTPGGTPCGNISGLAASMQKRIVRTMYTVPSLVAKIKDPAAKQYVAMRLAMADKNVGMIVTANSSTLIHLARIADEHFDDLVRDIADGTLSSKQNIDSDVRQQLSRWTRRRRTGRARKLQRLREKTGRCLPKDYWPRLKVVGVWTGGSAGAYVSSFREYYGEVPVRDHGLSASEGRMTVPFDGESSQGMLDVTSHFFEFIPENEIDSKSPTVLEAHELQVGSNYYILMTTASGFYRYNIQDVVRCNGFLKTTPLLEFLHKGAHISNLTGEKISESQVVAAVRSSIEQMPFSLRYFTVAPVWGETPRYRLYAEGRDFPTPEFAAKFAARVDAQLQLLNCEYREKRETGRLDAMNVECLPDDTWAEFTRKRQQKLGGSLEQYKHPCLVPDLGFAATLLECAPEHAA